MLSIRLLTLFKQRLTHLSTFLSLPRTHRTEKTRRAFSVFITHRTFNFMRQRQTITRRQRITPRSIRRLQRLISTMFTRRTTRANSTKVILSLRRNIFLLNLSLIIINLFNSRRIIHVRRPILNIFRRSTRLFFTRSRFPQVNLLQLNNMLIRFTRLFRPPININTRQTRFRRIRGPMITTSTLQFMSRQSKTVRFSNYHRSSRRQQRRRSHQRQYHSIRNPFPRQRTRGLRFKTILHYKFIHRNMITRRLRHTRRVLPQRISHGNTIRPYTRMFTTFPFNRFPQNSRRSTPTQPQVRRPSVKRINNQITLFMRSRHVVHPRQHRHTRHQTSIPRSMRPTFSRFQRTNHITTFTFSMSSKMFRSEVFLVHVLDSYKLGNLAV